MGNWCPLMRHLIIIIKYLMHVIVVIHMYCSIFCNFIKLCKVVGVGEG